MEAEEWVRGVFGDDAPFCGGAVDDVPQAGFGRVEGRDGIDDVAVVEDGHATVGEVGAPDAEDDEVRC